MTGFPVMVHLDELRAPGSQESPTGADLRFVDEDGTVLAHEIDSWVPGGDSYVWVRVPTVNADDTDYMWLYYGNANAPDTQTPAVVWKGYIGVYHLSSGKVGPTQFVDSTGTNAGAWENPLDPGTVGPGQINEAIELDGTHFLHIGDNGPVAATVNQARTVEAWIKTPQLREQVAVYEEGECVGWYLGMNAGGEYFGSFITDSITPLCDTGISEYSVAKAGAAEEWHYLTLVVDRPGLEMRLFVDGKLENASSIDNAHIADGNGVFRIGSDHDGGMGTFIGTIDEVRVSNGARSVNWIAAQHKSMTDTFLSFNVE